MTTIEERAARLREERQHWHCPCFTSAVSVSNGSGIVEIHASAAKCKPVVCTDDHNPTETALGAAALLFDVATDPDVKAAARVAYNLLTIGPGTPWPFAV